MLRKKSKYIYIHIFCDLYIVDYSVGYFRRYSRDFQKIKIIKIYDAVFAKYSKKKKVRKKMFFFPPLLKRDTIFPTLSSNIFSINIFLFTIFIMKHQKYWRISVIYCKKNLSRKYSMFFFFFITLYLLSKLFFFFFAFYLCLLIILSANLDNVCSSFPKDYLFSCFEHF